MSERYTRLFTLPQYLYTDNAPVVIMAGALLRDNDTDGVLAQLKFKNIGEKYIKAIKAELKTFDSAGRPCGDIVTKEYLDLNAVRDDEFGQKTAIFIENSSVRSYQAAVTEVIFSDRSVWHREFVEWKELNLFTPITEIIEEPELRKQFKIEFGKGCEYYPTVDSTVWTCACGAINNNYESSCHRCNCSYHTMTSSETIKKLIQKMGERIAKEKERIAAEKRQAEIARIKAKQKTKKNIFVVSSVICLAIAFVLIFNIVIIPLQKHKEYNNALSFIESGDYENALVLFQKLDGFCDSNDYISCFSVCYDTRVVTYSNGDTLTYEYAYDNTGNLTKEICINSDGDNIYTTEYTYDNTGNLTKEICKYSDGDTKTTEYTYDNTGNLTKEICKYSDGDTYTSEYTYDNTGNLTKEIHDPLYGPTSTTEYTYDNAGNLTKEILKYSDGDINTTEYTYDNAGNLTKEIYIDSDGDTFTTEYTYDNTGNLTKELHKKSDGATSTYEYTYDNTGNLTKEIYKYFDGDTDTSEYTYFGKHVFYRP